MKSTTYPGINYAGTTGSNVDKATGIHYGVISQNSVSPDAADEIYCSSDSTDMYYESYKTEVMQKLDSTLRDDLPEDVGQLFRKRNEDGTGQGDVDRHEVICGALTSALGDYFSDRSIVRVHEWVMEDVDDNTGITSLVRMAQAAAEEELGDNYQSDEVNPHYDDGSYVIEKCLDNDFFILKSPFFTYAQYCSPCVAGAGNLDTFCADGPKTYALGPEWFDGNRVPYPFYRVDTGGAVVMCSVPDCEEMAIAVADISICNQPRAVTPVCQKHYDAAEEDRP